MLWSVRWGCVLACVVWCLGAEPVCAGWKAGLAKANITPTQPMWLAGYGGRSQPSQGTLHDIWIKALALEDDAGYRVVLLTSDLCGMPKWMYDSVCDKLLVSHGLQREQIRINNSHNHCAPAVRGDLEDYYPLDDEQRKRVYDYSDKLHDQILETIAASIADLCPAELAAGEGRCTFAVNRRNNKEAEVPAIYASGKSPVGPSDHSVPVLVIKTPTGKVRGIVFAYACHATVLSFYQWCGDYPGFAQIELEREFPEAMALFVAGCGGDQNPLPRRTVELCEKYGKELATGVSEALRQPLRPLASQLKAEFEFVPLAFDKHPTRSELEGYLKTASGIRLRWAQRMLQQLDSGVPFPQTHPFAVQVWKLGDQHWIALGGESLVGYALRFKDDYGPQTWTTSYFADLTAYIPTYRNWLERGYEVDFLHEYALPADRWASDLEDRISAAVDRMMRKVDAREMTALPEAPEYPDHQSLDNFLTPTGERKAIQSVADWRVRRDHILTHFQRVAGPIPPLTQAVPLDVQVVEEVTVGKLQRFKLTYASEAGDRVGAYLFLPAEAAHQEQRPAVLCLHQTVRIGKEEPAGLGGKENLRYALELAERGFVTFAPDYPSFGEHTWDFFAAKHYQSGTMKAVWDNIRAVDYLQSLPEVDAGRIGVIGHSLGGHNAIFTALCDQRLKAVVTSCGFSSFAKDDVPSWSGPSYMPRIATEFGNSAAKLPFDFTELIAGIAPRACFINATTGDDDFDVTGVRDVVRAATPIYELYNAADRLRLVTPDAPHDFPPAVRTQAYEFLEQSLRR